MKKKILSILLIGFLIIGLTGCGSKKPSDSHDNYDVLNDIPNEILGTWNLNTNVKANNEDYSNLNSLFGTCLNNSENSLILNEDNTFKLNIGCYYGLSGKYKFENNIITFYDTKDANRTDEEDIENQLQGELINYKNKDLIQMYLYDFTEAEVYIFFEKTENNSYGNSEVPEIKFNETSDSNDNQSNSNNVKKVITNSNYALSLGKYEIYDDGKLDRILELKENDIFELTNVSNKTKITGTYKSCKAEGYEGEHHDSLCLYRDNKQYETFSVIGNNELSYQKGIIEYTG